VAAAAQPQLQTDPLAPPEVKAAVAAVAAPTPAATVADFEDDEPAPKSKMPLIVGLVGLAAAAGIGFFVLKGGGGSDDAAAPAVAAADDTKAAADDAKSAAPEDPNAAGDDAGAGEPADDGDAAGEEPSGEDPAGEEPSGETPEVAGDPEPAAQRGSKKRKKRRKGGGSSGSKGGSGGGGGGGASGRSADQLLADARKSAMGGDHKTAYSLAKQSYGKKRTPKALQLMGVSACNMKDKGKAKFVKKKLKGSKRDAIVSLCKSKGVSI
jgi:hypothetical protein